MLCQQRQVIALQTSSPTLVQRRWQHIVPHVARRTPAVPRCSSETSSGNSGAPSRQAQLAEPSQQKQDQQQQQAGLRSDPPVVSQQPPCPECSASGTITCKDCNGTGRLARGGYHKKNRVDLTRILESKWTAMEETLGWRHFSVKEKRVAGKTCFVRMQASCDSTAQLWVNVQALKDRSKWAAGWLSMSEVLNPEVMKSTGAVCRTCAGKGTRDCDCCDGSGRLELIQL